MNKTPIATALVTSLACAAWAQPHTRQFNSGGGPRPGGQGSNPQGVTAPAYYDAPRRQVDVEHARLEMVFPPLEEKRANCVATLFLTPFGGPISRFDLDSVDLDVTSVELLPEQAWQLVEHPDAPAPPPGTPLKFFVAPRTLTIGLGATHNPGERLAIRITYSLEDPEDGLFFILPSDRVPSRDPQVWTQGQTDSNRYWFPSPDFPNDRFTTDQILTVPSEYTTVSNGRLLSKDQKGDSTTWHWRMDKPMVSYLASIIIGKFDEKRESVGGVDYEYYVPRGMDALIAPSFGATPRMTTVFAGLFGAPYPFTRYAQSCVFDFTAGGMENATATTMNTSVLCDEATLKYDVACGSGRQLTVAHELAHQWFGDLITYRNWTNTWLSEGWAAYAECLWVEHECGRSAYESTVVENFQETIRADDIEAKDALAYADTPNADAPFFHKGSLPYNKGPAVLHALRAQLGEQTFWAGVKRYVSENAGKTVVTEDLRKAMEVESGRDLEPFFRQWVYTAGVPKFKVSMKYYPDDGSTEVEVHQTQKETSSISAFKGPVNLWFTDGEGRTASFPQFIENRDETFHVAAGFEPKAFAFDPEGQMVRSVEYEAAAGELEVLALHGPSVFAQSDAVDSLAGKDRPAALRTLKAVASSADIPFRVRREAARHLGESDSPRAREVFLELARTDIDQSQVQAEIADHLSSFDDRESADLLAAWCERPGYRVRRSALASLSQRRDPRAYDLAQAFIKEGGLLGNMREAGLEALGTLGDPRGIPVALRYAAFGNENQTRHAAVGALEAMGRMLPRESGDRRKIQEALVAMLTQKNRRLVRAAVGALGSVGDESAVVPLQQVAALKSERVSAAANQAIDSIRNHTLTAPEEVKKLQDNLHAVEQTAKELKERLDKLEGDGAAAVDRAEPPIPPGPGGRGGAKGHGRPPDGE